MTDIPQTYSDGELYHIPVSLLHRDRKQPRKYFDPDTLNELAASIERHGVIEPVLFRQGEDGLLYLISGERRWRAAMQAKLNDIPAIFKSGGNHLEIALVENLLREDLTSIEEAEAMQRMLDEFNYTQQQLAETLGKGRSTIAEILSLNRLPQEIRDECRDDPKCPRRLLVEITKKKTAKGMNTLFRQYKDRGLTSDEIRKFTRIPTSTFERVRRQLGAVVQKLEVIDQDKKLTDNEIGELLPLLEKIAELAAGMKKPALDREPQDSGQD